MRVLVAGAAGQLGRAIVRRFSRFADVSAMTRQDLDITVENDVLRVAASVTPDSRTSNRGANGGVFIASAPVRRGPQWRSE